MSKDRNFMLFFSETDNQTVNQGDELNRKLHGLSLSPPRVCIFMASLSSNNIKPRLHEEFLRGLYVNMAK